MTARKLRWDWQGFCCITCCALNISLGCKSAVHRGMVPLFCLCPCRAAGLARLLTTCTIQRNRQVLGRQFSSTTVKRLAALSRRTWTRVPSRVAHSWSARLFLSLRLRRISFVVLFERPGMCLSARTLPMYLLVDALSPIDPSPYTSPPP